MTQIKKEGLGMYAVEPGLYDRLRKQLTYHEGVRLKPYKDTVGKLTIGVGRNLDDKGINHHEAMVLLQNDIDNVVDKLGKMLLWRDLSEVRQRVMADMAFQMGVAGLMAFKQTIKAIYEGDFKKASICMLASKWAQQTPKRAQRLAKMMVEDQDPPEFRF